MLDLLRTYDVDLTELANGDGHVLVCPRLQGRIFCRIGDQLIHRLDTKALVSPSPTEFNNLGGNSLWPAPEEGAHAFNYLPGSDDWHVQKGIADVPAHVVSHDAHTIVLEKQINLINRKGVQVDVQYRRVDSVPCEPPTRSAYGLVGLTYRCEDAFHPIGAYDADEVLLAPWSLEQFPGAEGVTVFCKVSEPATAINFDFYTQPEGRIAYGKGFFTFTLGGEPRHQIGVRVASRPECIGALDTNRSILMIRRTVPRQGVYFNIADNDQPGGPYSAADCYSVFNGGALDFFELETIGAMQVMDGRVAVSTLESETTLLRGRMDDLKRYLAEQEGLQLG